MNGGQRLTKIVRETIQMALKYIVSKQSSSYTLMNQEISKSNMPNPQITILKMHVRTMKKMFMYYLFSWDLEINELLLFIFRQMKVVNRKTVMDATITTKFMTFSIVQSSFLSDPPPSVSKTALKTTQLKFDIYNPTNILLNDFLQNLSKLVLGGFYRSVFFESSYALTAPQYSDPTITIKQFRKLTTKISIVLYKIEAVFLESPTKPSD